MNKKLLLSLIIMMFVGFSSLSAQSINVTTKDGQPVENGATLEAPEYTEWDVAIEFLVTNTSANTMTIVFEKEYVSIVPGTTNNFCCFGECWGYDLMSSRGDVAAGETTDISCHYNHTNIEGTSILNYYIFDSANPDEKFMITVSFSYPYNAVIDYNDTKIFSNAYPSPANNQVNFKYDLPAEANSAMIVLFNMMGQEVKSQAIEGHFGTLSLPVSDLSEGFYFYSLIVNNKTQKTSKLVISR